MRRRSIQRIRAGAVGVAAITVALVLLLAGCGGSASAPVGEPSVGGAGQAGGGTVDSVGGAGGAAPPEVPGGFAAPSAAPSAAPMPGTERGPGGANAPLRDEAKVIKTGTLALEVADLDRALRDARTAIVGLGGYVSGSDQSNEGDRTRATIVYRIPAARWDDALDALHRLATKVVTEQTNTIEVTGQVLDLDARIRNLRATEAALQAIMARATKISDILEVQQQLTAVREQIEQLSTEKAHLEDQAAFGTLTVSYTVPVPAVTETTKGWDPAAEVDRAVASLVGILQGLASVGIWLVIVGLPILLALALLVGLVLALGRRLRPGRGNGGRSLPTAAPPTTDTPGPSAS